MTHPRQFVASLLPYLLRYKKALLGATAALLATAAVSLALGQGMRIIIDEGVGSGSAGRLLQVLLGVSVLVVVMAVGTFCRFYLVTWLGERVAADLRNDVFAHLLSLDPSYFETHQSGDIMARLTTDTTLLQSIIGSSVSFALRNAITMVGALVLLVITNFKLSLIVLVGVPLVLAPMLYMGRRVRTLSRQSQETVADVGSYAGEVVRQIKTVQAYVREDFEKHAFGAEVDAAFTTAKRRILQRSSLMAVVIMLAFAIIGVMVWVGGMDVINGRMTGGELAAFVFYAVMLAAGVAGISEVMGELQRAAGAADRIFELLAEQPAIASPTQPQAPEQNATHIAFDEVHFRYPTRDTAAIDGVSFAVQRGSTVALVGPSGAGKSTIFELLLRFYDPGDGAVLVDGHDIKQLALPALRGSIALVPQQPVLFSGDVWRNIRYGNPNASDEQVIDAARQAHALEFIEALPQGFASNIGEQGVRLSGGQKQRIAIARAILNNPDILLLDEATSALDSESEHAVASALATLMQNRTTLIIAHRLSTVVDADTIIVLDQGRINAIGKHDALLQQSDLYHRLAALQWDTAGGKH